MADPTPPRQVSLDISLFPQAPWATALVNAVNQFAVQVVQAFARSTTRYKVLSFTTRSNVAASFPNDVLCDSPPQEVRIAAVVTGAPSGAVTVVWQPLSSGKAFRVSLITGLAASTAYQVRLAWN